MIKTKTATTAMYLGLFFVALSTLLLETLMTRILSVTLWYHFAFLMISVAMFGMTAGAILVYLRSSWFATGSVFSHLSTSALMFGLTIVGSFGAFLLFPLPEGDQSMTLYLIVTFLVLAIPFTLSGICLSLALTKLPAPIHRLYAADLIGAAVGVLLFVFLLDLIDGPSAVLAAAFFACLGAWCFAYSGHRPTIRPAAFASGFVAVVVTVNAVLFSFGVPFIKVFAVKGYIEIPPEYETWNAFSRIRVWKHPQDVPTPYGWGMGANFSPSYVPDDLRLNIDGSAETVLTRLDAPLNLHTYLTYDVTNVGYYLAPKRRTLVVGAGGGRDVLSARLFNQPVIDAVEFNGDIINTVNRKFADFTGHLDQLSGVSFYRDEARNFLARSKNQYSMIQISMIDTWAASSAGAFSLTENGLYTREAWKLFIQRLYPDGILSVSRWYVMNDPVEAYRLTALAAAGLDDAGVSNPGDHLILIRSDAGREEQVEKNIFTLLLRPQAFTSSDIQRLTDVARDKGFVIIQAPGSDHPSPFRLFAEGKATMAGVKNSGLNFEPPTDDQPFFFQMQRLSDVFRSRSFLSEFKLAETSAVHIVATLLVFTILMTGITILLPLFLRFRQRGAPLAFNWMHVGYFVAIGFGFMLIEISQIQRLSLFLGHPSYSLLAVLFSILLSSGIGSFYAVSSRNSHSFLPTGIRLALLLVALILFGWLTPMTVQALDAANTMTRIAAAIGLLALPGFFMGMAFPIGMTVVQRRFPKLTPWMWGINGATSVCASVVAVAIALGSGLSATFWTGAAFYALAVSLLVIDRFREPGRVLVPA